MKNLFSAIILATLSFSLYANDSYDMKHPCAADVMKFCPDQLGNRPGVAKCIRDNGDKISLACKTHSEKMKEHFMVVLKACANDFKTHCGEIKGEPREKMGCIMKNKEKLSTECKSAMDKTPQ